MPDETDPRQEAWRRGAQEPQLTPWWANNLERRINEQATAIQALQATAARIAELERVARDVEKRAEQFRQPIADAENRIREASSALREQQIAWKEREERRAEQFANLRGEVAGLREEMRAMEGRIDGKLKLLDEKIPPKSVFELMQRAVIGVIAAIVMGVVSLWMGLIGGKGQ